MSDKVKVIIGTIAVIISIPMFMIVFTDVLVKQFRPIENAQMYQAKQLKEIPKTADTLIIMDWNIKFGGGRIDFFFDCYGDRVLMTADEVTKNLDGLIKKINQINPDVLLLQEIDIDSDRAANIDMMQYILDKTTLNYGAYGSQWQVNYVPSRGIGKVNSGNGILSKFPLNNAERHALPLENSQDPLTRFFYLRRNFLTTTITLPNKDSLVVLNTHLSAYAKDETRLHQIHILENYLENLHAQKKKFIAGGDLNTLPPGTKKLKGFDDSVCKDDDFVMDDYAKEQTWLEVLYKKYKEAIPLVQYQSNESQYYSHTVNGKGFWNRRLDYLFTNAMWQDSSGMIHQDERTGGFKTMLLSDHAPLTATLINTKQ